MTKARWTPALAEAVKNSKIAHKIWKKAGRPMQNDNLLYFIRKEATKKVRQIQRRGTAEVREKLYQDITNANISTYQKLFYKLVNKQRNSVIDQTDRIIVNKQTFEEYDNIIDGWQNISRLKHSPKKTPNSTKNIKKR